jgi:hypothetical protein
MRLVRCYCFTGGSLSLLLYEVLVVATASRIALVRYCLECYWLLLLDGGFFVATALRGALRH